MAHNPFSGIITSSMKATFKNAISAFLDDAALTVPCTLIYGGKFSTCANCIYDPIGRKSANRYLSGGPIPFNNGQICPLCHGVGKLMTETTESMYLMPIWDYKQWINFDINLQSPEGLVQTFSKYVTLPKIKRAQEIIIDTGLQPSVRHRFKRDGEPNPAGLADSEFIVTMWKRM